MRTPNPALLASRTGILIRFSADWNSTLRFFVIGESMSLRKTIMGCSTAVLVAAFLAAPTQARVQAPAQAAGQTSSLNGRVTDAQGAALRNAEVSLVPIVPSMPGMKMAPPTPIVGRVNADGTF